MQEIIKLINIATSQIFGALLGFQAALIFIDIMETKETWMGDKWVKKHKDDIKKRLMKIIIIIVILIVYVIVMSLIYKIIK